VGWLLTALALEAARSLRSPAGLFAMRRSRSTTRVRRDLGTEWNALVLRAVDSFILEEGSMESRRFRVACNAPFDPFRDETSIRSCGRSARSRPDCRSARARASERTPLPHGVRPATVSATRCESGLTKPRCLLDNPDAFEGFVVPNVRPLGGQAGGCSSMGASPIEPADRSHRCESHLPA
jgi:hypothetical protein